MTIDVNSLNVAKEAAEKIKEGKERALTIEATLNDLLKLAKESIKVETTPVIVPPKITVPPPTSKELAQVSRKFWWTNWTQWVAGAIASIIALISAFRHDVPIVTPAAKASMLDFLKIEVIQPYLDLIVQYSNDHSVLALIVGVISLVLKEGLIKRYIKEDVEQGRFIPSNEPNNPIVKNPETNPFEEISGIFPIFLSIFGLKKI